MVLLFHFVDPTNYQKRGVVMETPDNTLLESEKEEKGALEIIQHLLIYFQKRRKKAC